MTIAIIDYGMGNVKSVANALESIGEDAVLTRDLGQLREAAGLILPGVGGFRDGIANIREFGLFDPIVELVREQGRALLGICLGMQLLAEGSDERGSHEGLGLVPGWVKLMHSDNTACKVPHIGWNAVEIDSESCLFQGIDQAPDYYFVHSYHFDVANGAHAVAWCEHGSRFVAAVEDANVFGAQFHPEKSQRNGITLLKNFCAFAKSC